MYDLAAAWNILGM